MSDLVKWYEGEVCGGDLSVLVCGVRVEVQKETKW